ncbi:MAG: phosphatidate cytidylyltransferase [Elusimicrobia bacterium]|nr:phosphatidate cytidylyltransferase [Elusimicrobiota bacterium]
MRVLGLGLWLSLIARCAAALDIAAPPGGALNLRLPAASPRFVQSFSALDGWLKSPDGFKVAFDIDCNLALLRTLEGDARAAALGPIETRLAADPARAENLYGRLSDWGKLDAEQRTVLLKELSALRRDAEPYAASNLRNRVRTARERGAGDSELLALSRQAKGFLVFGDAADEALDELSSLMYERRIAPIESELAAFGSGRRPEELASGQLSAGMPRLARPGTAPAAPAPKLEPPAPKKSDLKVRALTAALLVPSIIGVVHLGGAAFAAFVALLAGLSMREYAGMLKAGARPVQPWIAVLGGVALALTVALHWPAAPAIGALALVAALRELLREDHSLERAALTIFGALLFGFLPAHLALVRGLSPFGERLTLMLFASAWATDTTAYFFGRRWGHRKIAPRLSPNKTWEGALAGFVGAMAAVLIFWASAPAMMTLATALAVGLVMGVAGQASGYLNSMIKRANGVKDSGNLLPGHGGVIDRFDAFILSSALVYALLSVL